MRKRPVCVGSVISHLCALFAFCCAQIDGSYLYERKATSPPGPPVFAQLSTGTVRGYVSYAAGRDKPVNVFKGIPFVEPPLGDLRFAKPKRKAAWNGTRAATEYSAACLSNITLHNWQKWIDEDCLYVNVFAGQRCTEDNRCPVLFYIHGGAFTFDSAVMFNDSQIVHKYASDDVVYVILAYRLGIFGLVDLGGDAVVPRNLALHDMLSALRWAQEELAAFGGDAKRITVFGNSAGGTAIEALNVSPAVPDDLFKQAFVSSGDAFFAENVNAAASQGAIQIVGCLLDQGSRERVIHNNRQLDCLRRVDALALLRAQSQLEVGPGVMLSGPETDTELLPAAMFAEILPQWKPRNVVFTVMLDEFSNSGQNITKECANHMSVFGYTSKAALEKCVRKYSNRTEAYQPVILDAYRAEAFLLAVVNRLKGGHSYLATFNLAQNTWHANDLRFMNGLHSIVGRNLTPGEELMDRYYPEMLKSFIRTGQPDKDWKPLDSTGRGYFALDYRVERGRIVEKPHFEDAYFYPDALKFWLHDLGLVERQARTNEDVRQINNDQFLDHAALLSCLKTPAPHHHVFDNRTGTSPMYFIAFSVAVLTIVVAILLLISWLSVLIVPALLGYLRVSDDSSASESSHIVTPDAKAMMYT